MIVHDLDIDRPWRPEGPLKADAPLVVDADAVLTGPIAAKRLQPIARQRGKISKALRGIHSIQTRLGLSSKSGELSNPVAGSKPFGPPVPIADNHGSKDTRNYALCNA
jgi:hypothetical protein